MFVFAFFIFRRCRPRHRLTEDVDYPAENLSAKTMEAITAATKTSSENIQLKPSPTFLSELIREKRELRKRWKITRCPLLNTKLNSLTKYVKQELDTLASEQWEERICETSDDWMSLHRLCYQLSQDNKSIRLLKHRDGTLRYRAADRAEIFGTDDP